MSLAILLSAAAGLVAACLALARVTNLAEAPRTFLALYGTAFVCYAAALWALGYTRSAEHVLVKRLLVEPPWGGRR